MNIDPESDKKNDDSDDWLLVIENRLVGIRFARLYWASIVLFVTALVGLLWFLPVPEEFYAISPILNWGSVLLMVMAVYYFIISLPLAIGMLPCLLGVAALQLWLGSLRLPIPELFIAAGLVSAGGVAAARQAAGPVLGDLLLAALAPAYLLSRAYRRLGIPI